MKFKRLPLASLLAVLPLVGCIGRPTVVAYRVNAACTAEPKDVYVARILATTPGQALRTTRSLLEPLCGIPGNETVIIGEVEYADPSNPDARPADAEKESN